MAMRYFILSALAASSLSFPGAPWGPRIADAQPNCGIPSRAVATAPDTVIPIDRLVAMVGDRPILCTELSRQYEYVLTQQQRSMPDSATAMKEMKEILNLMIDTELLMFVAAKQEITLPLEDEERAVDAVLAKARAGFGGNEQAFVTALRENGFGSVEAFRQYQLDVVRRQNIPQKLLGELRQTGKLPNVAVPDSAVEQQLPNFRKDVGPKPATISFRQIFLRTQPNARARLAARAKADSILLRLQKGEDFAAVAKAESMDESTRDKGGELEWQRRGQYYPEFERWVFRVAPGELTPVIETPLGFHVAKVDRQQPAEVKARHILIRPVIDSADAATNRALADSVAKMLRAGVPYDSLADKYNDPSTNSQRYIPEFRRDSLEMLFPEYAAAFKDRKPGDVTDPFRIPDERTPHPTYVVAVVVSVSESGEYTDDELRARLKRLMQESATNQSYLAKMRKQVYIRIFI